MSGDDLARMLAALSGHGEPGGLSGHGEPDSPRPNGRPPVLTPEQVRYLRKRRRLPRDTRPRVTELAAQFGVDRRTIQRALYGRPPYDFGDPAPRNGSRNRNRGSQRFWPDE